MKIDIDSNLSFDSAVELELAKLLGPKKYYSCASPYDRVSVQGTRLRRSDYRLWQEMLPDAEADIALVVAGLKRQLGRGDGYITSALYAHLRITEMPQLRALQESMFHLDLDRLKAIDAVMSKADTTVTENLHFIDAEITAYLTPSRPNQLLPSAAQIRRKLNAIIQGLDDSISTDDSPAPSEGSVEAVYDGDRAFLNVEMEPMQIKEIENRVRKLAKREKISQAEALRRLVRGEGKTDIVLDFYRATDVPDAPAWVPGVGWIPAAQADRLVQQATLTRDMDALYDKVVADYKTPADIRSVVIGLDGTCSDGDCLCHEDRTQMDHRIDHKDGGPTTAAHLAALCPTHHNIKTDGRVFYLIDPITRDKYFLYEDGTWVMVEAKGPLAPKTKNWLQTFSQRVTKRRRRIREESQARRETEHPPPPPPEEPPPF
ncbi:MAG: HNH endonuclease signature motif containing protein [Corynebacterium sp.]|uniref:HNH endonuclease signature motif containing protein n=1 Tax=Corynebacterium sp. TaxID=1720 RepID=UPI0026DFA529|nr:HNH endonuclease signature motif containing protein [Corynebacterium sp.]MDO5668780.1 HNH endonuclease signature motif containing protein [Corynebacterium sp.]